MLYTFGIAAGLLAGKIPPTMSWLLMAIPCLPPAIWCAVGFFRNMGNAGDGGEADAGLIVSAVGWALIAAGLIFKHFAIVAAMPDAYASQATSPATPLCLGIGITAVLLGAGVSWYAWMQGQD
jgi:hypothetical protein